MNSIFLCKGTYCKIEEGTLGSAGTKNSLLFSRNSKCAKQKKEILRY
jgi:hypothetical protein